VSELLVKKYGAKDLQKAFVEKYRLDLNTLSDLETERVMIQGQTLGWMQNFKVEPPENPLPVFDYGPYEPVGHMKNFIDECWDGTWRWSEPVKSGASNFRIVNHFATRCFYDLINRHKAAAHPASYNMICGPTSSGKTANAALYAISMMIVFRKTLQIKLVSTSASSAEDRVFGAAIQLFEKSYYGRHPMIKGDGKFHLLQGADRRILYMMEGEKITETGKTQVRFVKDTLRGIQLVPVQRGAEGQGAVRRLMGIKARQKLLIVDEAGDCDPSIFADNLLINWSKAEDFAQVAYLWNPKWDSRKAVSYLEPENGWLDPCYHVDSPGWSTKRGGFCTNLIGTDTPNREWRNFHDPKRFGGHPAPFPFLITVTDIEEAERKCPEGKESPAFAQMALGFLCDESRSNTIFTYRSLQEFNAAGDVHWTGEGNHYLFGIDPNLSGGDRFCICVGTLGYGLTNDGKRKVFLEVEGFRYVPWIKQEHGSNEAGQVRYVQELCAEHAVGSECVAADGTGSSMSFVTAFEIAMGGKMVHRVHFAAAPSERSAGPGERRLASEKFTDAKSEICYSVRDYLPFIKGLKNEEAVDQGCQRTFMIKGRDKICVENKHDFKKRIGGSPDEFDALSILVDIAKTMGLGTDVLSHPLAAQARQGRNSRIVTRANYARGDYGERAGIARYGIAAPV
jgi:hypothetical protein